MLTHLRKKASSVAAPIYLGSGGGDDGTVEPVEADLVDFPDELVTDTVYHVVAGLPPPLPMFDASGSCEPCPFSLAPWASNVVGKVLRTFAVVGELAALPLDLHSLSLVQSCTALSGGDDDGKTLDVAYQYIHWDSFVTGGRCEGRVVPVDDDGKVRYVDVGWGRRNIVDFGPQLEDGRTDNKDVAPIYRGPHFVE